MKRLGALLVVVLTFAFGSTAALADGTGPLFELRGAGCGVIDRDGSGVFTTDHYLVWRQSGEVYLRCEADGTPGSTIQRFAGFVCGLGPFGTTTRSVNVVRRAGRIQLECWGYRDPASARVAALAGGSHGAG
jgi:hypothetical protein